MADHNPARVALTLTEFIIFLVAMTLNSMAEFGGKSGVFRQTTEDVANKYPTDMTPAPWSMFMWDIIYIWMFCMFVYFILGFCRRNASHFLYTTPSVLPFGFHIALIMNLCFLIALLFLFDREMLWSSLIVSGLMVFTNYCTLFFLCHGLKVYGAWLNKYHTADLWLIRILIQNGVAVYVTWGTIATLMKLAIVLQYRMHIPRSRSAMISLLLLLLNLSVWFLFENFYLDLDRHVRYIVTIYPVAIVMLAGCLSGPLTQNTDIDAFTGVIVTLSCLLFVTRVVLVVWKHNKQPLYPANTLMMSPMELAQRQKTIFV